MRHSGSAKQRVWLGPDRYRRRCRDAVTNPEPDSYANRNSYTFCMWAGKSNTHGVTNTNGYCDSNSDSYGHSYSYSNTNPNFHAQTDADTEVSANAEGSSYSAAPAVEIFGGRNFLVIGDQLATPWPRRRRVIGCSHGAVSPCIVATQ